MSGEKRRNVTQVILISISFLLLFLFAFTISHVDCNTITTWAYDLLDSIRKGELTNFPVYTYTTHNMATNYSLISNMVNAVWLAPIYLIDCICGHNFSIIVYDIWFKVLILVISLISIYFMKKVLDKLNINAEKKVIGTFIMSTSAILLLPVLGKGQIDVFDMLLVILCIYSYLNKRIALSFLCIGIGVVFKPFIILLGVPYLLLMIGRCKSKTFINLIYLFAPYVLDFIITKLTMPRYGEMKKITSEEFANTFGMSRVEQIFNISINSIYIFLAIAIVICSICLYIGSKNLTRDRHLLLLPVIMFLAFEVFVDPTAVYWFAVLIPLLVVMGVQSKDIVYWLILNLGINIGIVGYIIFGESLFAPGKNYTILNGYVDFETIRYVNDIVSAISHITGIFITTYMASMLLICIEFYYERKIQKETAITEKQNEGLLNCKIKMSLIICQIIPTILYLVVAYILY